MLLTLMADLLYYSLGTMLNHSCLPNVTFEELKKTNMMIFETCQDIKAGDEICDNYIDITKSTKRAKK